MTISRRKFLTTVAGGTLMGLLPQAGLAGSWRPSRLTLQIGFNPGGSADTMGRLLATAIESHAGWDLVVKNKGGGGGVVMAAGLSGAKADGSAVGLGVSSAMVYALASDDNLPFTLDSFDFLGSIAVAPLAIMAGVDAPYDDMKGLVEWARENGGAVVGVNEKGAELIIRSIARAEGVEIKTIKARGGAEVLKNILGGHIHAGFDGGRHVDYMTSGDLKMIASVISDRHSYAPDVPTLIEQGYDFALEPYFVLMAPKGLSDTAKSELSDRIKTAVSDPSVNEAVTNTFGIGTANLGPEGTTRMMQSALDLAIRLTKEHA